MRNIACINLSNIDFMDASDIQYSLFDFMVDHPECSGFLLFMEHPPTYTIGANGDDQDFIIPKEALLSQGYEVCNTSRGGKITFHGLGQLVVYPIINLRHFQKDIRWYMDGLESWIIDTLSDVGIKGEKHPKHRGVWINNNKICAIGVAVKKWITLNGVGLNNNIDLSHFKKIIPCGIRDCGVTSIKKEGKDIDNEKLSRILCEKFGEKFECVLDYVDISEVMMR